MWIYIVTLFAINYHHEPIACPNGISECAINHMKRWTDTTMVEKNVYCQKNVALYRLKEVQRLIGGPLRFSDEYIVLDSAFVKK